MADLKDLAKRALEAKKQVNRMANEMAKDKAVKVAARLILGTPVDTSAAESNWQVSVGFPKTRDLPPYFPGFARSTAVQSAIAAIEEAKRSVAKKKPGQLVYIVNNSEYIQYLNEGRSPQAPAGFIEALSGMEMREPLNFENYKRRFPLGL